MAPNLVAISIIFSANSIFIVTVVIVTAQTTIMAIEIILITDMVLKTLYLFTH